VILHRLRDVDDRAPGAIGVKTAQDLENRDGSINHAGGAITVCTTRGVWDGGDEPGGGGGAGL